MTSGGTKYTNFPDKFPGFDPRSGWAGQRPALKISVTTVHSHFEHCIRRATELVYRSISRRGTTQFNENGT